MTGLPGRHCLLIRRRRENLASEGQLSVCPLKLGNRFEILDLARSVAPLLWSKGRWSKGRGFPAQINPAASLKTFSSFTEGAEGQPPLRCPFILRQQPCPREVRIDTLKNGPSTRLGRHGITSGSGFGKGGDRTEFEPDGVSVVPPTSRPLHFQVTSMPRLYPIPLLLALLPAAFCPGLAQSAQEWRSVEPLLSAKCYDCHGGA